MKEKTSGDSKPHYFGHRERMRGKLAENAKFLSDYELLEVLLYYVFPRKDTKELAKKLLSTFGSVRSLIFSTDLSHSKIDGIGKATLSLFAIIREMVIRSQLEVVKESEVIASSSQVMNYYKNIFHDLKHEQLRIMFLNSKNLLISEEVFQDGTINQTPLYPRTIMQRALELGAAAIIIVHNHPSGDPEPSRQDIIITKNLQDVAGKLDIALLDHLIVGKDNVFSMKGHGLI